MSDENMGSGIEPTDGDEEIPPWILQLSFLVKEETDPQHFFLDALASLAFKLSVSK